MFTILVSIVCSTLVFAGPVAQNKLAEPWINLRNDSSLARFQNNLLDPKLLTFLNDCYSPHQLNNNVRIPCARYFDAVLQLNSTDYIVQQPTVMKLLNDPNRNLTFCEQNHTFPAMKNYQTKAYNFNNPAICGYMCTDESGDPLTLKPICVFLAWMGEEIKGHTTVVAAEVPLVPETIPKSSSPAQTVLFNGGSTQDKLNPDNLGNKTTKPQPANKTFIKDGEKIKPVPAAENPSQVIEEKPAPEPEQKKEQPPNDHEINKALAIESAAAVLPTSTKAENKKEPSLPSNAPTETETTDEDALPKYPPNAENADSFGVEQMNEDQQNENDSELEANEENDDDDDDNNALLQSKVPKGIQTLPPAKPNQNSNIEIMDDNYLSKVNPVIDPFEEESGSNFFTYFLCGMFLCIVMYVVYHNKSKILALLLEGRRSDKGRSGRRKHTAAYRKLDSNLEEAITSSASGRITQIIY